MQKDSYEYYEGETAYLQCSAVVCIYRQYVKPRCRMELKLKLKLNCIQMQPKLNL